MITMQMTENYTGVSIRGDFEDFYELVEAFYEITPDENNIKHRSYDIMSIRVLGLCYNVRHAYMGDRSVTLHDNNMNRAIMKGHDIVASETNVYYEFRTILTEMIFVLTAIDQLINLRAESLSKHSYLPLSEKSVVWNKAISILRMFQSAFVQCIRESYSPRKFAIWFNLLSNQPSVKEIPHAYMDMVNFDYLKLNKKKRLTKLSTFTKRILRHYNDSDYIYISNELKRLEKEHGHTNFVLKADYPEEITW